MAGFGHRSSAEIQSLPSRRLFNNNYDSLEQKRRAKELRKAFVAYRRGVTAELPDVNDLFYAELLGRVRMDLVLSGTLVLTDAQLLDGALFMRVAADEFLSDLEIPGLTGSPIEIMRRGDSLAESLVAMLNRKGVAKPFEFSCLSTADSQRVYAELRRLQDEGLPGPTDLDGIDALFTGCRVPKRVREHLRQSWDSWDSMASSGRLPARKWEGDYLVDRAIEDANKTAKEDIRLATGQSPEESLGLATAHSQDTWLEVEKQLKAFGARSDIRAFIRAAGLPWYDEHTLLGWSDMVYGFALRNQHNCEDAEFVAASNWPCAE